MSITLEIPPQVENALNEAAAKSGTSVQAYVIEAAVRAAERDVPLPERNRRVIALMDEWLNEPVDEEEAAGYPETITPLSLREVHIE